MSKLVDQMINDPNSSLLEEDAEKLNQLPKETLKRLAIGMVSNPVPVANTDSHIDELRQELQDCQQDILELCAAEKDIRNELDSFGEHNPSILEQLIPAQPIAVNNNALSEQQVVDFVKSSKSVTAQILREAMVARDESRKKAIDVIISNASQIYTASDLKKKMTPELTQLADFVMQVKSSARQTDVSVYNWEGAGIADAYRPTSFETEHFGPPLELPSTCPENFQ